MKLFSFNSKELLQLGKNSESVFVSQGKLPNETKPKKVYKMTQFNNHNPKLANPIISKLLHALGDKWADVSYGNDCVASISRDIPNPNYDDFMEIYLPNSTRFDMDNEEFDTYSVTFGDGTDHRTCKTLEETIIVVQAFEFIL